MSSCKDISLAYAEFLGGLADSEAVDRFSPEPWIVGTERLLRDEAGLFHRPSQQAIDLISTEGDILYKAPFYPPPGRESDFSCAVENYELSLRDFFSSSEQLLKKIQKKPLLRSFFKGETMFGTCHATGSEWAQHLELWLLLKDEVRMWFLLLRSYSFAAAALVSHQNSPRIANPTNRFLDDAAEIVRMSRQP